MGSIVRIIITGATGFIGRYLIAAAKQNFQIICLTRRDIVSQDKNVNYIKTDYQLNEFDQKQSPRLIMCCGADVLTY